MAQVHPQQHQPLGLPASSTRCRRSDAAGPYRSDEVGDKGAASVQRSSANRRTKQRVKGKLAPIIIRAGCTSAPKKEMEVSPARRTPSRLARRQHLDRAVGHQPVHDLVGLHRLKHLLPQPLRIEVLLVLAELPRSFTELGLREATRRGGRVERGEDVPRAVAPGGSFGNPKPPRLRHAVQERRPRQPDLTHCAAPTSISASLGLSPSCTAMSSKPSSERCSSSSSSRRLVTNCCACGDERGGDG